MEKLDRSKLWSLEQYAEQRDTFRASVIAHKRNRRLPLGDHATLIFEDFTTMKYQVQEMLRTERIFNAPEIAEEIAAYNPLIPDGCNWKATFMIEYADDDQRRVALARLKGVEHRIWTRIGGAAKVFAIANEDMERSTEEKTAAVHFLRFELDAEAVAALRTGAALAFGIDHPALDTTIEQVPAPICEALLADLD